VKRIAVAIVPAIVVAFPVHGSAQPIYPNVPPPPVNLDPGSPPPTTAPVPDRPAAPAPQPSVIVVGPDGKIVPQPGQQAEPNSYYVGGGDAGAPADEPDVIRGGPIPELHVVRRRDTLWDICFLYFNDPWQWPKIWSYNPQITNPHWIYPGDLVRLLPRGMFAQTPAAPTAGQVPAATPEVDALPAPQRRTEVGIKQTAFVEKSDLDKSITIDGADDEKVLLGNGDQVYLRYPASRPPRPGERYSIYVPGNPIKSGNTEVGAYVHVLGSLEVTAVTQDKRARGVIVEASQEIERGAKVGPLLRTFKNVPPVPAKVDVQGTVVAMLTYDQLIGDGEVVFVDLGRRSGIEVGNSMFVVRRGDAYPKNMSNQIGQDDRKFPSRRLGRIVIVEVGDRVSVGLVTLVVQEMSIGDLVVMQATK
jgi:nucleoid-associated protein YgaU